MRILLYVALAVAFLANNGIAATAESDKVQLSNAEVNSPVLVANDGPKGRLRKLDEKEERSKLHKVANALKARKAATKKLHVTAQKMKAQANLNKLLPKNSISNEKFAGLLWNKWTPEKAKSLGKIKTEAELKNYAAFLLRQKNKAGANKRISWIARVLSTLTDNLLCGLWVFTVKRFILLRRALTLAPLRIVVLMAVSWWCNILNSRSSNMFAVESTILIRR